MTTTPSPERPILYEAAKALHEYAASVWFDEALASDEERELMHALRLALSEAPTIYGAEEEREWKEANATEAPSLPGREDVAQLRPRAWTYRYADPFTGKPVWRMESGPWNGQREAEAVPLYTEDQILALQPRAEEWRPIEDAPRDGTHILACDGRVPYDQSWTFNQRPPTVVHWFPDPNEPGFYTSVNDIAPESVFPATHSAQLPPPPKPEVEG